MNPRLLPVRVTPRASRNEVQVYTDLLGNTLYRVYITQVPEQGKANAAVLRLLAKHLNLAPSRLKIQRGEKDRDKLIQVKPD